MKEANLRLAVLTALRDAIDKEVEFLRQDATAAIKQANESLGVKSLEVSLPGGKVVAALSLAAPDPSPSVHDEQAFAEWVSAGYPTEVVPTVRPAFKKSLLGRLEVAGDGAVDPETGEVVPGVGVRERAPYVTLRFKPGGRDDIAVAWRNKTLPESVLPQLDSPA